MKAIGNKTFRNLLIVAGFYGIYYAVFQFIALLWRNAFVFDRTFSNLTGQIMSWTLYEIPFWIYLALSGFLIPLVVESKRIYIWAVVMGGIFVLNSLLFSSVHYATAPTFFDNTTRFLTIFLPLALCPLGSFLQKKWERSKTRTNSFT